MAILLSALKQGVAARHHTVASGSDAQSPKVMLNAAIVLNSCSERPKHRRHYSTTEQLRRSRTIEET